MINFKKSKENNQDCAIEVKDIDKSFWIANEKVGSLKGYFMQPWNIFKKRGHKFDALSDVSFNVKKGEFLGIIGRNGSGKSTLLKLLAGIYTPDKGSVKLNGKLVPFLELGVGFNQELTGYENIFLNGTILGMSRKYLSKKWREIIKFAELEDFVFTPVKNYSSGMMLRLAFAIAMQSDAEIYLMDEVLAVGDANFQSRCIEVLMNFKRAGKTIVLVTHDVNTVQRFCDRAILVKKGKIVKDSSPKEIIEKYVYENMMDEEKRLSEKQDKNLIRSNNTKKKIEITDIYFLDKNGRRKNIFNLGDSVRVHVEYKKNIELSKKDKLNFGIALFSQEDVYIFGTNTFVDNVDTKDQMKREYFEIVYNNLSLIPNTYYVSAGIWGNSDNESYDLIDKSNNTIKIYSKVAYEGIVKLDYKWM